MPQVLVLLDQARETTNTRLTASLRERSFNMLTAEPGMYPDKLGDATMVLGGKEKERCLLWIEMVKVGWKAKLSALVLKSARFALEVSADPIVDHELMAAQAQVCIFECYNHEFVHAQPAAYRCHSWLARRLCWRLALAMSCISTATIAASHRSN